MLRSPVRPGQVRGRRVHFHRSDQWNNTSFYASPSHLTCFSGLPPWVWSSFVLLICMQNLLLTQMMFCLKKTCTKWKEFSLRVMRKWKLLWDRLRVDELKMNLQIWKIFTGQKQSVETACEPRKVWCVRSHYNWLDLLWTSCMNKPLTWGVTGMLQVCRAAFYCLKVSRSKNYRSLTWENFYKQRKKWRLKSSCVGSTWQKSRKTSPSSGEGSYVTKK